MALFNLPKRDSADKYTSMFSYMTDEELIDKALSLGREVTFERYLLPHEREELRGIKAQLLSRLRSKNKTG